MSQYSFYGINTPYGMRKINNKWIFFNRKYLPLGSTERPDGDYWLPEDQYLGLFKSLEYTGLGEKRLESLAGGRIEKDGSGKIVMLWFYNDSNSPWLSKAYESAYFQRLSLLREIEVKNRRHE